MKNLLTPGSASVALLLVGSWASADAQMLGTPVADPLMGKPLEMSLPARFASADAGDECVQADVFYGENRVKAGDVRASITGPADQRRIRIESAAPIDEPIVTVSVRAGCRNTVTRNYTLLPEYPSERLLAAAEARTALAAAAAAAPLRLAAAPTAPPRRNAQRPVVLARADAATAPAPSRSIALRVAPIRKEAAVRGPRLRLEPIEMPEPQAVLRVSNVLAEPTGDASRRATAALLWQAINADPQEVMRTSVMIQKLEQDLAQLRQSTSQTRAEMALLRQRLDQAQQQPWYASTALLQVLALLVLASATAAGVLWYRTRRLQAQAEPWYVPEPAAETHARQDEVVVDELVAVAPVAARGTPDDVVPTSPAPLVAVPAAATRKVDEDDHTIHFDLPSPAAAAAATAKPEQRTDSVLRVETLAATLEEVDFLRSLGLRMDAMDILKTYLQDSTAPAPLAYLELMRLCEEAEDPAAVAIVRRRYAQSFGVEAPRLAQVTVETGLDAMPDLVARVTRAWGTAEAQQAIEEALFLVPTPTAPITLQAGRDLLALHDLALVRAGEGTTAAEAPLAPWAHAPDLLAAQHEAKLAADAEGGRNFALDVDLTSPAPLAGGGAPAFELAPVLERVKDNVREQAAREQAAREEAARRAREQEDAFSAAVASERAPVSRY